MGEHLRVTTLLAAHPDEFPPQSVIAISRHLTAEFSGSQLLFGALPDGQEVVLKASAYKGGTEREWQGLALVTQQPRPVQQPVAVVSDEQGVHWLMTERVLGQPLHEADQSAQLSARHQVGQLLAEIHRQVVVPTQTWVESQKSSFEYYDRYLQYWLRHEVPHLEADSRSVTLLQVLAQPMIAHLADVEPSFTHQDIHDGQVLVAQQQATLIDFEWWQVDDQLIDLAMYLFHSLREARPIAYVRELYRGYYADYSLTDQVKHELAFYVLFIAARAVATFRRLQSPYLPTAEQNLATVTAFIDQEQIWKKV